MLQSLLAPSICDKADTMDYSEKLMRFPEKAPNTRSAKEKQQAKIAEDTADYLAKKGKITELTPLDHSPFTIHMTRAQAIEVHRSKSYQQRILNKPE